MNGFLTKKMMEELQLAGFDINKFYTDCFYESQFIIIETRRMLTNSEIEEMINDGDGKYIDNSHIIEKEDVACVKIGETLKLSPEMYAYATLSTADLITYLEYYFICNYKICCDKNNEFNYTKIEYIENGESKLFELEHYNPSFEYLLYSFIIYLLDNETYLLKV